ncbi:50S ribosomal protein L21 [Saccharicrinis fermentans]|uniref:Large ribosomal subunit protein bL21 n=2 Tax=Saccharicrinis fermentans TaxID=982 RepID=W7YH09_9BACT|nr:50S ribosomal protein L21 [Saccharicrinis fermentans]GAF01884.1 50S ribosomal protein L21 [Saccharicrinis fermentans DSM 9555 = JCM 21142]
MFPEGHGKVADCEIEARLLDQNFKQLVMYAIVDIAGQQFKVEKDSKIYVHRLAQEEGAAVEFEKVMLIDNDGTVQVGAPVVEGAKVTAKVLSHVKGDKVIVFKKKRRKGYKKKNGHRQQFSQIQIEDILVG